MNTHNGTNVMLRHLYKLNEPPMSMGGRRNSIGSTSHVMGRCPGRLIKAGGPPNGQGGRRHCSSRCTPHVPGYHPVRLVNTCGAGRSSRCISHISWATARPGPTRVSDDDPRPGPAHRPSTISRPARSGPSILQIPLPGPARPISFSNSSAGPGPVHHILSFRGPARPMRMVRWIRPGPAHDMFEIDPA